MRKTMKLVLWAGLALNLQTGILSAEKPLLNPEELAGLFEGVTRRQPIADTVTYPNVPMAVAQEQVRPGTAWVRWMGNGGTSGHGRTMVFTPTHLEIQVEQPRPLPLSARIAGRVLGVTKPLHSLRLILQRDGSLSLVEGNLAGLGPLVRPGWSTVTFPLVNRPLEIFGYTDLGATMTRSVLRGLLVVLRR